MKYFAILTLALFVRPATACDYGVAALGGCYQAAFVQPVYQQVVRAQYIQQPVIQQRVVIRQRVIQPVYGYNQFNGYGAASFNQFGGFRQRSFFGGGFSPLRQRFGFGGGFFPPRGLFLNTPRFSLGLFR